MEFESRVLEVVEPRLKSLRELFQDRDVQALDLTAITHLLLETKFELLKLNDYASMLTRQMADTINEDADDDDDEDMPDEKDVVNDALNAPMTNGQRSKIIDILSKVDQANDKVDQLMSDVSRLGERANSGEISIGDALKGLSDIIANYQIDDISDKVDQIYDELKPGSLFPKIGNTVSWIDHNVRSIGHKLNECCDTITRSLGDLGKSIDTLGDIVSPMADKLDAISTDLIDCCSRQANDLADMSQQIDSGFSSLGTEVSNNVNDLKQSCTNMQDNLLSAICAGGLP